MASVKTTLGTFLVILILAGLGAAGGFGWIWWQERQIERDLALAEQHLEAGEAAQANQLLQVHLAKARPGKPWVPAAADLRFEALEQMGDVPAQQTLARQVLDADAPWAQPGHPAWARAHVALGTAALDEGNAESARAHFEPLLTLPADSPWRHQAEYGMARLELAQADQIIDGKQRLQALVDQLPENSPLRPKAEELLGTLNVRMLMHPQPYGNDELYSLQKGDTIAGLSKRFGVSGDLIMRVNNITDPRRLTIGRRLKIPHLDLSIVVNKTENTLTVYNDGQFFKKYPVRTGEHEYMTPAGEYRIQNKTVEPSWTNPQTGEYFAPGAPGNELGSRWLGFSGSLGIHEAIDPESIGTYSSNGCVGLVKEDVQELFDLVRIGTPVKIVGQTPISQP